jgi:hypothetical protein
MLDVTLRLRGRSLHIVRHAVDCDSCRNHAAHTRLQTRPFVRGEIERAVREDGAALARLRELVAGQQALPVARRVIDAEVLKHLGWLLETGRLIVFECIEVQRELPKLPRAPLAPRTVARPPRPPEEELKTWVGIELVDDRDKPVANQRYRVKVPGGTFHEGTTDAKGQAKITNLNPGGCEISFPDIHAKEWKKA